MFDLAFMNGFNWFDLVGLSLIPAHRSMSRLVFRPATIQKSPATAVHALADVGNQVARNLRTASSDAAIEELKLPVEWPLNGPSGCAP